MNVYKMTLLSRARKLLTEIEFELMEDTPRYERVEELKGYIDDAFTEITDRTLDAPILKGAANPDLRPRL